VGHEWDGNPIQDIKNDPTFFYETCKRCEDRREYTKHPSFTITETIGMTIHNATGIVKIDIE